MTEQKPPAESRTKRFVVLPGQIKITRKPKPKQAPK